MRVRKLARRVTQIYDDALAPFGLTIGQMGLLANLRRSRPISIGALSDRLASNASTISRLIRPLEAAGLVSIGADDNDRRAKAVRLTDAGAGRVHRALPGWQAAQDRIAEQLGAERLGALRFLLDDAFNLL
jgi:DNA-binding MarR family transcriptional regulator